MVIFLFKVSHPHVNRVAEYSAIPAQCCLQNSRLLESFACALYHLVVILVGTVAVVEEPDYSSALVMYI